jgi:hypothetical protein
MHMFDFHSKLTSVNEEGHLFEALRSLTRIEDPREVFDGEIAPSQWTQWPPMDARSSCAASAGV